MKSVPRVLFKKYSHPHPPPTWRLNGGPLKMYIQAYSVKRSDVTGNIFEWLLGEKQCYIRPPPPYFTVLVNSVRILEVKAIEFHRIGLGL